MSAAISRSSPGLARAPSTEALPVGTCQTCWALSAPTGAWPYALPYPGLDPAVAAMAASAAGGGRQLGVSKQCGVEKRRCLEKE